MWRALKEEVRAHQALLDGKIAQWYEDYAARGGRITCGKGCSNCCTLNVNATLTEALLIGESLTDGQMTALMDYVARLQSRIAEVTDLKSFLRLHRKKVGFCPFVDEDGACGVYALRPLSCRALLATRPSDWCAVDFGDLPQIEKTLFMGSLDRSVVAFPTHYVEATQEWARDFEVGAIEAMIARFGVAVTGNLGYLIHLVRHHGLHEALCRGADAVVGLLDRQGLDKPYLIHCHIRPS